MALQRTRFEFEGQRQFAVIASEPDTFSFSKCVSDFRKSVGTLKCHDLVS